MNPVYVMKGFMQLDFLVFVRDLVYTWYDMKPHSSRTIFIFLGILVLIFLIIFGMEYFKSDYSYQEVKLHQQ